MNREKRIDRLTSWQIALFVVPIALHVVRILLPLPKNADAQLTWTLVRFGITVLALIGVGVLEWQKRMIRKQGQAPVKPDQPSFDI